MSEAGTEADILNATQQSYSHSVKDGKSSVYMASVSGMQDRADGMHDNDGDDPFRGGSLGSRSRSRSQEPSELVQDEVEDVVAPEELQRPISALRSAQPSVPSSVASQQMEKKSSARSIRSVPSCMSTHLSREPTPLCMTVTRMPSTNTEPSVAGFRNESPPPPPVSAPTSMQDKVVTMKTNEQLHTSASPSNPYVIPDARATPHSETTSYAAELSIANSRNTKLGYNSPSASNPTSQVLTSSGPSGNSVPVPMAMQQPLSQPEPPVPEPEPEENEEDEDDDDDQSGMYASYGVLAASMVPGPLFSPYEPPEQQNENELNTMKKKSVKRKSSPKKRQEAVPPPFSPQREAPTPLRSPPENYTVPRDVIRDTACEMWDSCQREMNLDRARSKDAKMKKMAAIEKRKQTKEEVIMLQASERANQYHAREKYPEKKFDVNIGKGKERHREVGSLWLTESTMKYEEVFGVQPISSPSPAKVTKTSTLAPMSPTSGSHSPPHGMRTVKMSKSILSKARLSPDCENSVDAVARLKKLKKLSASPTSSPLLRCPKPSSVSRPTSIANPHHPDWKLSSDGTFMLPDGSLMNIAEHPSLRRGYYA
eukprot:TRINITY_DN3931_c0_g1_i1.p1 TRINITY_DN3931_c0_g1~~TRINITY_DN3931_c0_g1_i1.p1  ORF type:complete len:596 (+),score=126.56 TRINITY_DN3931_c0_g1_i1:1631-3418(+)